MAIAQWWHCVDLSVNKGTRRIRNVGWTRQRSETAAPCITASEHEPQDSHLKSAAESRHFPCVDAVGHGVECCISHQYIVLVGRSAPSQKHFAKALELKRFFEEAAAQVAVDVVPSNPHFSVLTWHSCRCRKRVATTNRFGSRTSLSGVSEEISSWNRLLSRSRNIFIFRKPALYRLHRGTIFW